MVGPESYIDIHTHQENTGSVAIRNLFPEDGNRILPGRYYSVGLHPWYIEQENYRDQIELVEKLAENPQVLAIGEAGLDKITDTSMDLQMKVFREHIRIAETNRKPLIIHIVKTYDRIVKIKKETKSSVPWIIHGFDGKPELAEMLLQHGFYLSIGGALKNEKSHAARALGKIPADRLFLETDAADLEIEEIYSAASGALKITVGDLKRQITKNFNALFFNS